MSGNLLTITKSGEQPFLMFHSFHENRLALSVKTRDPHQEPIGRVAFFRESKTARGDIPQNAICNLNIHLPDLDDVMKSTETDGREEDGCQERGELCFSINRETFQSFRVTDTLLFIEMTFLLGELSPFPLYHFQPLLHLRKILINHQ
jgi:hypothetical protein